MGLLAQWRFRPFKNWAIKRLIRKHQVDLSCVEEPDVEKYPHFNAFFIRTLTPESRPIAGDPLAIASPADGFISQIGAFHAGKIIQAKSIDYSADQLLGCDARRYGLDTGHFVNVYLSPRDYHRVHLPFSGQLKSMTYIPGRLYSVNPAYVETIPGLFTQNERVVTFFETDFGYMAIILVGAMVVGKIQMAWETPNSAFFQRKVQTWDYQDQHLTLEKGQEIGYFLLGSTVIALFPNQVQWDTTIKPGDAVKMGQAIGKIRV